MEPRELPQEQSSGPRIVTIDLEEKSQSSTDSDECPEAQVNPGDTVNWTSTRITDTNRQNVKLIFTDGKHPFKQTPRLEENVVADAPGVYSYTIREGDAVLGCGNIKTPCQPPNGGQNQGGSGT